MVPTRPEGNARAVVQSDGSIDLAGNKLWLAAAEPQDKPYILSTWFRSYKDVLSLYGRQNRLPRISHEIYAKEQERITEALWASAFCLKSDDGGFESHGFVVGSSSKLHYVYVFRGLRNMGLARSMVDIVCGKAPNVVEVSHLWPHRWPNNWRYNPWSVPCTHKKEKD